MFDSHEKLVKKLTESGRRAPAEVLEVDRSGMSSGSRTDAVWSNYKLRLRVQPEGGEPFETRVKTRWYPALGGLLEGMTIEVLYDPNDRDTVVVDYEGALQQREVELEQRKAALRARGYMQTPTGYVKPEGQPDVLAGADRLNEMAELLRAKMAERGATAPSPAGGPPAAAPAPDRLDQLAKLGQLHSTGVLSDAEFEAEKRKILGG